MDRQGSNTQVLLLLAAFLFVVVAWFVWGPAAGYWAVLSAIISTHINALGDWYQQKVEGPTKLIAPLITILSGSWAIMRAWKYAESRLHYRLHDFVHREEERLKEAREKLRLSIERPGMERPFTSPIFLSPALKKVVTELGWGSYWMRPQLGYVDHQVGLAIDELEKQVAASGERDRHLNKQLATAHLLKGAIIASAAAEKERVGGQSRELLTEALNHFKAALVAVPNDIEALEYASHMHVRLSEDAEADQLLNKLLGLTPEQSKSLPRARALRYKGCIAARRNNNGNAVNLLRGALNALPLQLGIDRIEEAEIYESLASCQEAMRATVQAANSRESAASIRDAIKEEASAAGPRQ